MSIATSLAALQQAKTDIASAITNKGGTVNTGDGFADFAAAVTAIPAGTQVQTATGTLSMTAISGGGVSGHDYSGVIDVGFVPDFISFYFGVHASTGIKLFGAFDVSKIVAASGDNQITTLGNDGVEYLDMIDITGTSVNIRAMEQDWNWGWMAPEFTTISYTAVKYTT